MAQNTTEDELAGRAEQLPLPIEATVGASGVADLQWKVDELLRELDLIPSENFAKALGIAEQTLAGWRCNKQGPDFAKLGKSVFYRRCDIVAWIAKNISSPAAA